jgi:hypothetical protein
MRTISVPTSILFLCTLYGCSATAPNYLASEFVKSQVIRAAQGGTITVSSSDSATLAGVTVVIPPGSLSADTRITVGYGGGTTAEWSTMPSATASLVPQGVQPAGPVVYLGPDGTVFQTPATVTLPFALPAGGQQNRLAVYALEGGGQSYTVQNNKLTISGGFVTFTVNGFTQFQPGEYIPPPPDDGGMPDDGGVDGGRQFVDAGCAGEGLTQCSSSDGGPDYCADTRSDSANCGGCGQACGADQICDGNSSCQCRVDGGGGYSEWCNGVCVATASDPNNCGYCGARCPSGICENFVCIGPACNAGPSGYGPAVSFAPPVAYSTVTAPWKIVTADFNHDGIQDFVTAGGGLMFGLSDGGLSVGTPINDSWAWSLQTVDFNADGWPDVIMAGCGGTIDLWLNQHDGSFAESFFNPANSGCVWGVGVADFNNDGLLDLAACTPGGIELLFQVGDAGSGLQFSPASTNLSTSNCDDLAVLRNSDGIASLASIDSTSGQSVTVWLGIGDGGFQQPMVLPDIDAGLVVSAIQAADLNLDGLSDLIVAGGSALAIYLNADGGAFAPGFVAVSQPNSSVYHVSIADVNGDGFPDVVSAGSGACGGDVQLFVSDCHGGFITSRDVDPDGGPSMGVAALQSATESRPGLVTGNLCTGEITVFPAKALACLPTPTWGLARIFAPSSWPTTGMVLPQLVSADFNQDGIADLVSSDGVVMYGLANGGLVAGPTINDTFAYGLQAVDLNGDGWPDIVMEHCGAGDDAMPGHVGIWMNLTDGGFTGYALSLPDGGVCTPSAAVADFNGDGILDLALCTLDGLQMLYGDGGFIAALGNAPGFMSPQEVLAGDCEGLATWHGPSGQGLAMTGTGPLFPPPYPPPGAPDNGIMVWPTVVLTDGGFATPTIYAGNDAGVSYWEDAGFVGYTSWTAWGVVAADLNGDGITDLVVAAGSYGIEIYLGIDGNTFAQGVVSPAAPGMSIQEISVGDFNGDGYPDIAGSGIAPIGAPYCQGASAVQLYINDCQGGLGSAVIMYQDGGPADPGGVAVLKSASSALPSLVVMDFCNGNLAIDPNLGPQ